jgi:Fe-S-cluster containining protein
MPPDVILLEQDEDADLPAGEFADWLTAMARALDGRGESDVPCGDCDACCRSGYFIEVKPSDDEARRRIPAALLFDAPGAPAGHQLLGYDEAGRCPMLEGSGCTIYADRPNTCRTYDCRIFAAAGIAESAAEKADVTSRARRWQFGYRNEESREMHRLFKLGAHLLVDLQQQEGASVLPRTATQLALLAVQLQDHFQAHASLLNNQDEEASRLELREGTLTAVKALMA